MGSEELEHGRAPGPCEHRRQQGRARPSLLAGSSALLSGLFAVHLIHGTGGGASLRSPSDCSAPAVAVAARLLCGSPPSAPHALYCGLWALARLSSTSHARLFSGVGGTSRLGLAVPRRALVETPTSEATRARHCVAPPSSAHRSIWLEARTRCHLAVGGARAVSPVSLFYPFFCSCKRLVGLLLR